MNRLTRLLQHRWREARLPQGVVSEALMQRLTQRVQDSERHHGGQIRILVEAGLPLTDLWQPQDLGTLIRRRAVTQFGTLRVWDTEANSGVLIYLLLSERAIEIVADRGLNGHVSAGHWRDIAARMAQDFRDGDFERGLMRTLDALDAILPQCFAQRGPGGNELPDRPVLG